MKFPTVFIYAKPETFKIVKEKLTDIDDYIVVPYKKRKLFGWKRLTTTGFSTVYLAMRFLESNYGDVFGNVSVDFD